MKIQNYKELEQRLKTYFKIGGGDYKIVRLTKERKSIEVAIVNTRIKRTSYVLRFRIDLQAFVEIIGIFDSVSNSTFYWLQKVCE